MPFDENGKRIAWNSGKTKKDDPRIAKAEEKKKQTNLAKYGVENVFQSTEVLDKLSDDRHSGKLAKKAMDTKELKYHDRNYNNLEQAKKTKLDKYGDENYNNQEKYKQTSLDRYGTEHPNQNDEQKLKISNSRIKNNSQEKAKQTIIAKYGNMESYYSANNIKRLETMKANGTLGNVESKPEKELYKILCDKYGENHVFHPYYDKDRYPFNCDFYIDTLDLFIELHGFFTHGTHPYDENNPEDLKLAIDLEDMNTPWSRAILYTWTDLDVRKLETAKNNNLNYKAIYWYNEKFDIDKDIV